SENLAILGGPKAVQRPFPTWPRKTDADAEALLAAFWGTGREAVEPGGVIGAFERDFAAYQGRRYALAVSGGTAALTLGVMAAGAGPGDEVVVSPYTWGATVGCILAANAIPVFADVDPRTLNVDPAAVERKITPRTKAIVVVHMYGQAAEMSPIMEVARGHGLAVIEDCAQAHGAVYEGRKVGSIGDFGCFSFQASKHLPTLEGGMLLVDEEDRYQQALMLAMHPRRQIIELEARPNAKYLDSIGFNFRMHPYAAALGRTRLPRLDADNVRRRRQVGRLAAALADVPGIEPLFPRPRDSHTYYTMPFRYHGQELHGLPRAAYLAAVQAEGVDLATYVHVPIHLRPRSQEFVFYGKECPWHCPHSGQQIAYHRGDCPNAEAYCAEEELTLYTTPFCDADDELVDQVALAFAKVAEQHGKLLTGKAESQAS
nr:DegT/DnrJ/EryC1/StrS family aminotransferase [Dehalococcoidales bacterium]